MSDYKRFTHNPDNIEIASPCYLCKHKEERPIRNKQKCSMEECDYLKCYEKLAELEDKIENGTLIDINDIWYENEEIKGKKRYIICQHYLTKMIVDFADNKAEAEQKLKELKGEV